MVQRDLVLDPLLCNLLFLVPPPVKWRWWDLLPRVGKGFVFWKQLDINTVCREGLQVDGHQRRARGRLARAGEERRAT